MQTKVRIFGLDDPSYTAKVMANIQTLAQDSPDGDIDFKLAQHKHADFTDGECLAWSAENVRNTHCYVLISLATDRRWSVNDKIIRSLFFVGSLWDASVASVTLVTRFWPYGRQDRKDKPRKPVATKYRSQLMASMKLSRVITLDVHNPSAEQSSPLGCPIDMLEARKPIADQVVKLVRDPKNLVTISPDVGGVARTKLMQKSLSKRLGCRVGYAQFNKEHTEEQETVIGEDILGNVRGKEVWMVDDMGGTFGTVRVVQTAVEAHGGYFGGVMLSHGLGTTDTHGEPAWKKLEGVPNIVFADSIDPFRFEGTPIWNKIHIVDTSSLVANAIFRTEQGGSLGELLDDD